MSSSTAIKPLLQSFLPEIIALRHQLHAHPELAHEEFETAALISKRLQKFGYEVQEGIAGTGVSAVLDSGKPGKTVALRADIDALPIHEKTNLSYASKIAGKMHACGHDGHTATLLAAAGALIHCKKNFKGKIKFIFQPAEETGTGAVALIEAGILENPKVDAIFGYHNSSQSEFGVFKTTPETLFVSSDAFTITIHGKGGHAAYPNKTIDPIYIGSLIVQALQGIISRCSSPMEPAVLSITQFHAGTTHNVIPSEVILQGTVRAITPAARATIKEKLIEVVIQTASMFGATADVHFSYSFPPTINHLQETELAIATAESILGKEKVVLLQHPAMASEDFSYYLEKIPGCYFWVGMGLKEFTPHQPSYEFNDAIIPIAAEILAQVAIEYLNQH